MRRRDSHTIALRVASPGHQHVAGLPGRLAVHRLHAATRRDPELLYFAYGSNLARAELKRRCPGARPLYAAVLEGHRRDFTRFSPHRGGGVVDIVPDAGAQVRGAVYDIPAAEMEALDEAEAVPSGGYERIDVELRTAQGSVSATTYRVVRPVDPIAPTIEYLDIILVGLSEWGMPAEEAESVIERARELGLERSGR